MTLSAGARVGPYEILAPLGAGGMGEVYKARDPRLNRVVAIKTLRQTLADDRATQRFLQEARAGASVSHPNVCQVYEIGEEAGRAFIAMELLEGESLATRLGRGRLALTEAVQTTLGILSGLQALHQRGLVHRDLKPSNVLLTPHGVKLLDFGLARYSDTSGAETQDRLTLPGTILGTPYYMAPEQVLGEAVDVRTDLFAVGVMVFEMLTGDRPFAGESVMVVLHAIVHDQPPALVGSAAVAAVDRVIHRALAKQPIARQPSAEAMAQELRGALLLADSGERPGVRPITRLAVLPFHLLRADPDVEFLTFSLADAVTASLSGLESLVVRSSRMGARFADEALDLKRVAAELDVDIVLTGTLLRASDRLRVATQLVEVADGKVLWSQTSQVALGDLFQLQDELVARIVGALPLTARDKTRARPDVPANAKTYELYLRANQVSYDASTWALARDLYLQCLDEDPGYAPAWARLGRLHWIIGKFAAEDAEESTGRAEAAFRRALELNPNLSLAHNHYAYLEVDVGRAEAALRRLLEQARHRPADPELFAGLVHGCRFCGLLEASIAAYEEARRLDPSVPTSVHHTYLMLGEWERVVEERHRTQDVIPSMLALWMLGRRDEALALLKLEEKRYASHQVLRDFTLGLRGVLEGKRDEALRVLQVLLGVLGEGEGLFYVAKMMASLGEVDAALAVFQRVVASGFFCFPAFLRDPSLDALRGRAEFATVLRQAEARHRAAGRMFVDLGGERLLGVRAG